MQHTPTSETHDRVKAGSKSNFATQPNEQNHRHPNIFWNARENVTGGLFFFLLPHVIYGGVGRVCDKIWLKGGVCYKLWYVTKYILWLVLMVLEVVCGKMYRLVVFVNIWCGGAWMLQNV